MQWFKVNRRLVWGLKFNPENLPALVALTMSPSLGSNGLPRVACPSGSSHTGVVTTLFQPLGAP